MTSTTEKLFSKSATRRALKISRARYEQFIESGILPEAFEIVPGSRPVHTETQIRLAEANLYARAIENIRPKTPGAKPIKPVRLKPNQKFI